MSFLVNPYRFATGGGGGSTVVEEFAYTGASEETTVPSGYTSVTVWLWGGAGGNGNWNAGAYSGGGGFLKATFACSPGDTLKFEVAGGGAGAARGANGGLGGWPDGGDGGRGDAGSGGGGGSTRFYINNTLKAVAGGGGGSGGLTNGGSAGGGGGTTGQSCSVATGGTGGSQIAGGVDGSDTGNANKTGRSIVSYPTGRTGGFGSSNGDRTVTSTDDGGGGGGGYWGGGGGGGDARAGGGGSSWTDSDATSVTHYQANRQTSALAPLAYPAAGNGVNSGANGSAVSGANGYAMAFFGTAYSIGGGVGTSSTVGVSADEKTTVQVTVGAATAKWLYARLTTGSATNHRAIIYTDNAGSPDTLVGTAGPVANAGPDAFTVFDLADLALAAGTYWVGIHSSGGNTIGQATGGDTKFTTSDAYSDGTATAFGATTTTTNLAHIGIVYL